MPTMSGQGPCPNPLISPLYSNAATRLLDLNRADALVSIMARTKFAAGDPPSVQLQSSFCLSANSFTCFFTVLKWPSQ